MTVSYFVLFSYLKLYHTFNHYDHQEIGRQDKLKLVPESLLLI